ncbi:DUF2075 family protein [Nocardioides daedukensis]|uniref:DUF2075 family protein n=1 Tax=Nocardioides daedukensis TaxID=634462 RepID=A0A7Y9UUC3_9ACTN|nr:DNA/RNA helicase domain-containing protein [Nocardioides daedukensis]NYG60524.1 DUF2075 family protein [Nocardioides daedukensis]
MACTKSPVAARASPTANALVAPGVIHTIQTYDVSYAGVIIGSDLRYDREAGKNMPRRGISFTDDEILRLVQNVHVVLLTRGMRGTYARRRQDRLGRLTPIEFETIMTTPATQTA